MANKITEVTAWKDTSGNYHETPALAQLAQDDINLKAKLTEIVDNLYYHSIQPHEIVRGIMDHIKEIREILK